MIPRKAILTVMILILGLTLTSFWPRQATGIGRTRLERADRSIPTGTGNNDLSTRISLPQTQPTTGTILRTLFYHEITRQSRSEFGSHVIGIPPILSDNGNRAVFVRYGARAEDFTARLFVVEADGSAPPRELDPANPPANLSDTPDISADGKRVVYPTNFRGPGFTIVDVGPTAGSDTKRIFALTDAGSTSRVRISGDGSKVFYPGSIFLPNGTRLPFGIHAFNAADGSYLGRVVSDEAVARLFGLTASSVSLSDLDLDALSVSHDGLRIAFVMRVNGDHLAFSVNLDGSGLVSLLGATLAEARQTFVDVGISGDGLKVAYNLSRLDGTNEIGVIAFDGNQGTRKVLLSVPFNAVSPLPTGLPVRNQDPVELNTDGSRLLLGTTGVLADTVTNDPNARFLQLAVGHSSIDINSPLIGDGLFRPTMNSNATRFLYITTDANNVQQLATLDISANRGSAPDISDPKTDPTFLLTDARSTMTLSARVSPVTNTTIRPNGVSGRFLRLGLHNVFAFAVDGLKPPTLFDDGTDGDPVAADGVYTRTNFRTLSLPTGAVPGPRTIRINAEIQATDNRRHATAIDFEPFTVTDQPPLIDLSTTSLEFGDVTVNQSRDLPLTVRNIGNTQLTLNSFSLDNGRFTIVSPTAPVTIAAGSQQTITVRFSPNATGQQRGTLTIASTDPARPSVTVALAGNGVSTGVTLLDHRVTGGPIPGGCEPPVGRTSFTPTDAAAIQWAYVSGARTGDAIRWEFVQPNGSVYQQFDYSLVNSGQVCFWSYDGIKIAGQPAASLPGNWQVRVFYNNALLVTDSFTIGSTGEACPTITGISPASVAVGGSLTITGTNFTGVSAVKFSNNVTATPSINSDTQITVTVPGGAVSGPLTISKPNCADTTSTTSVTVTPGGPCIAVAISDSLTGNNTLTVPIAVSDTTGKGALSYDAVLSFDPAVLRLQSVPTDKTGTLSSAMTITTNTSTAGQLQISGFGTSPLVGAGTLLNLKFDVIGTVSSCTNLTWVRFRFNEGTPCATTTNGRACVVGASIAGLVNYCITPKPVPGALISATGAPVKTFVTGNDGVFRLSDLGGGAYTLTPAKTGEVNGISSFDAALVALHVVGASTLNSCQQTAGDASNNGALSSFDAALMAQYVVGIANPANFTGTWKFAPPSRSYAALSGEQANQNFDAVLVGDVSGNWSSGAGALPPSLFASSTVNAALQTMVSLPSLSGVKGTTITLPVTVGDLTGKNVIAYDFDLTFDPAMLQPLPTPYDIAGTISSAMTITANATTGRLRISGFGTTALTGAGVLLNLNFNIIGAGATSALTWQKFALNEETLAQALLTHGSVMVPPANVTVSAASYRGPELAADSIVAAFGADLATSVVAANTVPLPTTLAGTTVRVRDSAGVDWLAPLFFVAPQQVNYLLPPATAPGAATVTITSGAGAISTGAVQITSVAAGLFAANSDGQGPPAGYAIRVRADGAQLNEAITRFDSAQNKFVLTPLELGPTGEQVFLVLFGTGFRAVSSLSAVSVKIGGVEAQVLYAGAQGGFVGLDQMNLLVPRALSGRGEVDVVVMVEGKTTNTLKLNLK